MTDTAKTAKDAYLDMLFNSEALRHDAIAYFKAVTSPDNPDVEGFMGTAKDRISTQDFVDYCQGFAEGLEYVRDKHGFQPAIVSISREWKSVYTDVDSAGIYVPMENIEHLAQAKWLTNDHTAPFLVGIKDTAFLTAVSMATALELELQDPARAKSANDKEKETVDPEDVVWRKRVYDAERTRVHQAMIDKDIVHHAQFSIVGVNPKDTKWLNEMLGEDFLRARTHPSTTVQLQPEAKQERVGTPQTIMIQA